MLRPHEMCHIIKLTLKWGEDQKLSNTCLGTRIWAQDLGTHTQIKIIKRKIKLSHQFISLQSFFLYFYLFLVSVPNKYYLYLCLYKYFSLLGEVHQRQVVVTSLRWKVRKNIWTCCCVILSGFWIIVLIIDSTPTNAKYKKMFRF
jgi:hypothetical protein